MHLYGFYVIDPFIIAHEPPYQTYSSVGQAGFRRRFLRMNDRTNSSYMWARSGSPQSQLIFNAHELNTIQDYNCAGYPAISIVC